MLRRLLPLLCLSLLVGCAEGPEHPSPVVDDLPSLAGAKTQADVLAWMGAPCATRKNPALPLGEDWLYCVEPRETGGGWRLARACVAGCPVLVVTFAAGRYVWETAPHP